jgi:hypothetical protein
MQSELESLLALHDAHEEVGKRLFDTCNAEIYPCDALAFSILERSLNLLKGFHLLLSNGGYTPGVGLLRMQLDSILRFSGVARCTNPHETAASIINGVELRKLKDRSGSLMNDSYLVSELAIYNPWVTHVYKLSSGYIHLSDQHFYHFLLRTKWNDKGERDFGIGDSDENTSLDHKIQLVNAFSVLTRGILKVVNEWADNRCKHGTAEQLRGRFPNAV